ncbi:hypothetical protein MSAN_01698300 [Mycena sanguinolenta]|uniref:Uncharacterized protein n=1 Tax=Mycena sanguinolenta TaxID=230812 RepID=A0A8H6Y0U2_9AGAR|nr:hypothetical protein MSAN_01698300 [Mycena sanguinolenta]
MDDARERDAADRTEAAASTSQVKSKTTRYIEPSSDSEPEAEQKEGVDGDNKEAESGQGLVTGVQIKDYQFDGLQEQGISEVLDSSLLLLFLLATHIGSTKTSDSLPPLPSTPHRPRHSPRPRRYRPARMWSPVSPNSTAALCLTASPTETKWKRRTRIGDMMTTRRLQVSSPKEDADPRPDAEP